MFLYINIIFLIVIQMVCKYVLLLTTNIYTYKSALFSIEPFPKYSHRLDWSRTTWKLMRKRANCDRKDPLFMYCYLFKMLKETNNSKIDKVLLTLNAAMFEA